MSESISKSISKSRSKTASTSTSTSGSDHTAINVAIVGHTNVGKTSLMRTLLRDDKFGEIDDAAGTTRHVEKSAILCNGEEVLNLFDTPGLEDSSALLQVLEEMSASLETRLPVDLLRAFVLQADSDAESYAEFAQEAKVLRQAINSDVLLYIIDVREPLLGKYLDEIEILSRAGKPILPVFNFIAGNSAALKRWREQMTRFNLHAALEFDTVAFSFEAEKRLYQKLQSLLEPHYDSLQALIDYRLQAWQDLTHAAARQVFQLLVQVAAYRFEVAVKNEISAAQVTTMQDFVRRAEQRTLQALLKLFAFTQLDVELQKLPVQNGRWQLDIFSPSLLKDFGLNAGATALKGAAAGAGIDLMVGGMSLGAATLLGAALGAGWATVQRYQQELMAAIRGHQWLCVDNNTLALLYLRQQKLLRTLMQRGHAASNNLQLANLQPANDEKQTLPKQTLPKQTLPKQWQKVIDTLRQKSEWQDASSVDASVDAEYQHLQAQVVEWLLNNRDDSSQRA